MILAPKILPTEREDCFFTMAVMVVMSSGREVPTATMVTPMTRSEMPMNRASSLPLLTSKSAPQTMPTVPRANFSRFAAMVRRSAGGRTAWAPSAAMDRRAEDTFSTRKAAKTARRIPAIPHSSCPAPPQNSSSAAAPSISADFTA